MFKTLRRAIGLVDRRRRRLFVLVGMFSLCVSVLEAVAAVLVLLLIRLVTNPNATLSLPVVGDPEQAFPDVSRDDLIVGFSAAFLLFFAFRAGAFLVQQYVTSRVAQNTGVQLSHRLLRAYLSAPYEFHLRRNSAESMRNVYENVRQLVSSTLMPVTVVVAESVLIGCMAVVLVLADPLSTLIALIVLGSALGLTLAVVQPRVKVLGRRRQAATRDAIQHVQQGLQGIRDIKVAHCETTFSRAFAGARARVARTEYLRGTLAYVPRVTIEMAFLLFILAMLVVSRFGDSFGDLISTLGLFAYAGLRIQPSLQKIATALNNMRFGQSVVEELWDDFAELDIRVEEDDVRVEPVVTPLPFTDALRVERVSFSYRVGGPRVLHDVSFTLRPGESLGMAGQTGCGKSTLLDIVCGLLTPDSGHVTVDGVDIADDLRSWHEAIGVVHQHSFLTDDTIRRNIAFGVPDDQVDPELLQQVMDIAALRETVDALADGLDTPLGERGVRFSGGQRQRVALARALYRRPRLLILDEATSALDNATERQVVTNIERFAQGVAIIAVAHRMRTIMACDRVLMLSAGRLVGTGSYDELCRTNAEFAAMSR